MTRIALGRHDTRCGDMQCIRASESKSLQFPAYRCEEYARELEQLVALVTIVATTLCRFRTNL